jgi:hypothetical protein
VGLDLVLLTKSQRSIPATRSTAGASISAFVAGASIPAGASFPAVPAFTTATTANGHVERATRLRIDSGEGLHMVALVGPTASSMCSSYNLNLQGKVDSKVCIMI